MKLIEVIGDSHTDRVEREAQKFCIAKSSSYSVNPTGTADDPIEAGFGHITRMK